MMIFQRARGMMLVHNLVLAIASGCLFWALLGFHVWVLRTLDWIDWTNYWNYSAVVVASFGLDFVVSKVRRTDVLSLDLPAVLRLTFRQTAAVLGTILFFLVASKDPTISRLFLFTFVPVLYGGLLVLNRTLPVVLARLLFFSKRREKTLLVGSIDRAEGLLAWCRNKAHYGMDVVGLVTDETEEASQALPVLGRTKELESIMRHHAITHLIALHLPNSISHMARMGALCDRMGIRLLAVNDLQERFDLPISFFTDGGLRFVALREEPLECPFNRMVKRVVDIALSLPVIVLVLPPLSLLVWAAQSLQSPGPLFFRQQRGGINFKGFSIFKFRTMHKCNGDPAKQATKGDTRVFIFGRWLRRLSLDEIPQFINVLKGEMSIVGPRPHMLEHDDLFAKTTSSYNVRSLVKPGITGLAQVRGLRGETLEAAHVAQRVASDVYYLENWSLSLEVAILFKTAWHMIAPPKSAY